MENKIMCDCGVSVNKRNLSKHKKSKEHLKKLKQMEAPRETSPYIEEDIEDKSEADEEQSEVSAKEVIEDTKPEEEDYEIEEDKPQPSRLFKSFIDSFVSGKKRLSEVKPSTKKQADNQKNTNEDTYIQS
jgi:hypothetical protein